MMLLFITFGGEALNIDGKRILITGGTGSLGRALVRRMLSGSFGSPAEINIFSRDEAKQHYMRLSFLNIKSSTDEIIYENSKNLLKFHIGDVRDYHSVLRVLRGVDIVIHAAALKQVPNCEYFPMQAIKTNILGTYNLILAIIENKLPIETVVGVSTDKACKPINTMGMTKALMERILIEANIEYPTTRFVCVRYGNVISSRGSVVPLFLDQIRKGGPLTITDKKMTRFLLTLDQAVDTIFTAVKEALPGEIFVPMAKSAFIVDVAKVLMNILDNRNIPIIFTGIRPGEKIDEILISEEEAYRTIEYNGYYVIRSMLPELEKISIAHRRNLVKSVSFREYSSSNVSLDYENLFKLLSPYAKDVISEEII